MCCATESDLCFGRRATMLLGTEWTKLSAMLVSSPVWSKWCVMRIQCSHWSTAAPRIVTRCILLVSQNTKRDALKAGLELQFMTLLGEPLAKAAYFLEGDGFLAPYAFSRLNTLNTILLHVGSMDTVEDNEYLTSMRDFANRNPGGFMRNVHEDVISEVWRTRTALVEYWKENVWKEMRLDILLFKGFSVLDPIQLATMSNAEVVDRLNGLREGEEVISGNNPFRRFRGVKGFNENIQTTLIAQLPAYRLAAEAFAPTLVALKATEQPARLWEWWWSLRDEEEFSQWCLLARIAVLHQPSSAVIERFFSVYKGMTSTQQCAEDAETSLVRAQARYNKGKVGL